MGDINRPDAKLLVGKALHEVADFNGDFENFTFEQFQPFHKTVFLFTLKLEVNRTPCLDYHGNITDQEYLDIDLSDELFNTWEKVADCIDYVENNHYRVISPISKLQLI